MRSALRASRQTTRLAGRYLTYNGASRGFRSSARLLAAHNFAMPAMSPTMTEGNVASWKVKEGDSFSTGDVLLEIETDKAQMDVEAQDDGIMAKILVGDGTKGVKIGSRIAILAEEGDDLSTLEIPPDDSKPASPPKEDKAKSEVSASPMKTEAPPAAPSKSPAPSPKKSAPSSESGAKPTHQTYPLYPSVAQLFHENNIPLSEADNIPASGPKGRLLKGDILAYIGKIPKEYPGEQSTRIANLGHLDLSNIQKAAPTKKEEKAPETAAAPPASLTPPVREVEISLPISLTPLLQLQNRLKQTLGSTPSLSELIERAVAVANDGLPRTKNEPETADELFNEILGEETASTTSRGHFFPQITGLGATNPILSTKSSKKKLDIIDILTGPSGAKHHRTHGLEAVAFSKDPTAEGAINVFSVKAMPEEERRAKVFLERVKTVLQVEPGRLVL
ncbi:MAG: pyridoxine biosynthesis protein [Cirrosporium novae-zelandiae]|nr:MAG: pyridoxine biosynthesis protein [Cirrosporium novae-zelandiae]